LYCSNTYSTTGAVHQNRLARLGVGTLQQPTIGSPIGNVDGSALGV
jgi:hypothetical protein